MHFTGNQRDSESGLDNFSARFNSSNLGRFMSPDPDNAGASADNPQSWNAYAYADIDPLISVRKWAPLATLSTRTKNRPQFMLLSLASLILPKLLSLVKSY